MRLTTRQDEILNWVGDRIHSRGQAPTRAEIARHFGFRSPNAAECHLKALKAKGFIELVPGVMRGIRMCAP